MKSFASLQYGLAHLKLVLIKSNLSNGLDAIFGTDTQRYLLIPIVNNQERQSESERI